MTGAEEFDTSGPGDPVLVSTTWYYYTFMGNVERVGAPFFA